MTLRHRNHDLIRFEWTEGCGVRISWINDTARRFLPLAFGEVARVGDMRELEVPLAEWLCRRTAPMGRHFIRDLMASLGLNMRDPEFHRKALEFSKGLSLKDSLLTAVEKLRGFRFRRHQHYNLPTERLGLIQGFLQKRVDDILRYSEDADKYIRITEISVDVNSKVEKANVGVNVDLDALSLQVLWNMKADPFVTAKVLADVLGVEQRTIERRIRVLREKKILKRIGEDKSGHWQVLV